MDGLGCQSSRAGHLIEDSIFNAIARGIEEARTPRSASEASSEVLSGCAVRAAIQRDAKEIARLREIEHRAWHLLDDSEYRMDIGERVVSESLFGELCELLPEGHPEENVTDATTDRRANNAS